MGKHHLDEGAEAIRVKWAKRLGDGWDPSLSDVVKHLDARVADLEKTLRDRDGRRLISRS